MEEKINPMLRRMNIDDLELVLSWRNHPEVSRYMYTQHMITMPEHERWFSSASKQEGRHLLIFEINGHSQGFVNLNETIRNRIADWGFYMAPDSAKGTGIFMGESLLAFAFDELGLHKVCGQVISKNLRSVKFHERLGFKKEGQLREHYFDGNGYQDIINFGILSKEWKVFE